MSNQFTKTLPAGGVWIHGELALPPAEVSGSSGPMVMGADWMLEMVRFDKGRRTVGLFLASFGLVNLDLPEFAAPGKCSFVGFSTAGNPPADWLKASLVVDMGKTPLAASPEELLRRFARPMPYRSLEASPEASALSLAAKRRISETYHVDMPISEIAAALSVSHAHLTRQFKRDFGFTPLGYRHRLRVSEATARLSRGDNFPNRHCSWAVLWRPWPLIRMSSRSPVN
jgi:AraC-like DNA-binding protein